MRSEAPVRAWEIFLQVVRLLSRRDRVVLTIASTVLASLGIIDAVTLGSLNSLSSAVRSHGLSGLLRAHFVITTVLVTLFVVRSVIAVVCLWQLIRIGTRAEVRITEGLVTRHLASTWLHFLGTNQSEQLRNAIEGVPALTQGILVQYVFSTAEIAQLLALIVGLCLVSVGVTLVVLPIVGFTTVIIGMRLGRWSTRVGVRAVTEATAALHAYEQAVAVQKEAMVYGDQYGMATRISRALADRTTARFTALFAVQMPRYLMECLLLTVLGGGLVLARLIMPEALTPAAVIAFALAGYRAIPSLYRLNAAVSAVRYNVAYAGSVLDWLGDATSDEPVSIRRQHSPSRDDRAIRGDSAAIGVRLSGVTFTYPGAERPALSNVTLSVRPGELVGIAGRNGSGKTTLVDVIAGLLEPSDGRCEFVGLGRDGSSRPVMSYVTQEGRTFVGTLRENVAGFGGAISDAEVRRALKWVGLSEDLEDKGISLDDVIGPGGVRFSGGQQQRVALARALVRRPSLIIIDEGTSALDPITERAITDFVGALRGSATIIVVAHRINTLQDADTIVFLDHGRVAGSGVFSELRSEVEEFAQFAQSHSLDADVSRIRVSPE